MKRMIRSWTVLSLVTTTCLFVSAKPTENGQSLVGRDGVVIDCRTEHDSYFPDPDDCRSFYHCSDWAGLERKSCGTLFFHPQKRVCDWPDIVRRVRHDCPEDDQLPPLELEVVSIEELEDSTLLPFDDGSYNEFEPDPENKFRFPTEKPRPKTKKPLKSQKPDDQEDVRVVFEKNVDEFKRGSLPDKKVIRIASTSRPSTTLTSLRTITTPRDVVLVKKRPTHGPKRVLATTSRSTPIVKSLPTRNIVKSLPDQPHRFRPPQGNILSAANRRPGNLPTRTRYSQTSPRRPLVNRYKSKDHEDRDEEKKKPFLICSEGKCVEKESKLDGKDVNLFKEVVEKKNEREKKKIQELLQAAIVDDQDEEEKEDFASTTELNVETTSDTSEEPETTTMEEDEVVTIRSSESPFRAPEERPEFLQVIREKAEKFKELLEREKQKKDRTDQATTTTTSAPNSKVSIVTSTSSTIEIAQTTTSISSTQKAENEEKQTSTTIEDMTTLSSIVPDFTESSFETTELPTTISEEEVATTEMAKTSTENNNRETSTDVNAGDQEILVVEPSPGISLAVSTSEDDEKDSKDAQDVFVVDAVPLAPNAQPFVADGDNEHETANDDVSSDELNDLDITLEAIGVNPDVADLPEGEEITRATRTTPQPPPEAETTTINYRPSGYEMLTSVLSHINLEALMHHVFGEEAIDKPEIERYHDVAHELQEASEISYNTAPRAEALIQTTKYTTPSTTKTSPTSTVTKEDSTTSTSTSTSTKSTTKTMVITPEDSQNKPMTTMGTFVPAPSETTTPYEERTSVSISSTENVLIVLPVGYETTTTTTTTTTTKRTTTERTTTRATTAKRPWTTSRLRTSTQDAPKWAGKLKYHSIHRGSNGTSSIVTTNRPTTKISTTRKHIGNLASKRTTESPKTNRPTLKIKPSSQVRNFKASLERLRQRLRNSSNRPKSPIKTAEPETKGPKIPTREKVSPKTIFEKADKPDEEDEATRLAELRKRLFATRAKAPIRKPLLAEDESGVTGGVQNQETDQEESKPDLSIGARSILEKIRAKRKQSSYFANNDNPNEEDNNREADNENKYKSIRCRLLRGAC